MQQLITKAATLIEALPYLQKYRGKTFVFKYGGHAMQDAALRESFLKDVILLKHVGIHPVIVHGGGPQIEALLKRMGVKTRYANGLRITDKATMEIVEMVLVGQVNSKLVSLIHKLGGVAVGFSGTDGNMILAKKLPPQEVTDKTGKRTMVDLGMVGEVVRVNPGLLVDVIREETFIPIVSPIGMTQDGQALNINADAVACEIAKALSAEKLILVTNVKGILDKAGTLLAEVGLKEVAQLIADNVIEGGMIPKVKSAAAALKNGVGSVVILDGTVKHAVLLEIFTDRGVGTLIQA